MQTKLNPYISFDGNAREAMEFYKSVFGGNLEMTTVKESGMSSGPEQDDRIMHAMLVADNGITLMGADLMTSTPFSIGSAISISISGDNEEEITGYFNKLSDGGNVVQALEKAPWGDTFGMLTDRNGFFWMVNITAPKE